MTDLEKSWFAYTAAKAAVEEAKAELRGDEEMTGSTPGPWEQRTLMVIAPDGSQICHTGGTRYSGPTPQPHEAEANARLIAAAPDLLAALKKAREELQECAVYLTGEDYNNPRINAAIARAEGTGTDAQPVEK